ncbi:hypothetical protein, partial [Pseudomonas coronafaciens]|uniref:hypothetical protein n=1 Tax=Pseudomonas coronafaciens TaxID=53409 RepID=UPI001C1F7C96
GSWSLFGSLWESLHVFVPKVACVNRASRKKMYYKELQIFNFLLISTGCVLFFAGTVIAIGLTHHH